MTRHTVGAVLTTLQHEYGAEATNDLMDELDFAEIPTWYYLHLLVSSQTVLQRDDCRSVFCTAYQLHPDEFDSLFTAPNLTQAVQQIHTTRLADAAWRQRQRDMNWPDSQVVAEHLHQARLDQIAARLIDLLRRTRRRAHMSVGYVAQYLDISPLTYWQIETGQLPMIQVVYDWLSLKLQDARIPPMALAKAPTADYQEAVTYLFESPYAPLTIADIKDSL